MNTIIDGWIDSRPMTVKEHEQKVIEEIRRRAEIIALAKRYER